MKKYAKALIILFAVIISLICFPKQVSAKEDLNIPEWTVHASLKENGDLVITEDITFEFNKKYNGVYRDIVIDKSCVISGISVKEAKNDSFKKYEMAEKAENGDTGVYTLELMNDRISIKIFSPSKNEIKTFRISYVVNNAAIKYSDTGELYYQFLGKDNKTPIGKFTVYINLLYSYNSDRVKIYAHGPSNGIINKISENQNSLTYLLQATDVEPKTLIEARLLFPAEYIAESKNVLNIERYQQIVNEETALLQKKEQKIVRNKFLKELFNRISVIICGINISVFLVILYMCRRKVDRKALIKECREIPEDCTPAVASYIAGLNVNSNVFLATILDLFSKGYVKISKQQNNAVVTKKHFTIYKNRNIDTALLTHERYFMTWLFDDLGDGESVGSKDIEYYSKYSSMKFYQSLNTWKKTIKNDADKKGYIDHSKKIHGKVLIILSTISIALGIAAAVNGSIVALPDFTVGLTLLIYGICLFNRLSDNGFIMNKKWRSFIRYMKKHNQNMTADEVFDLLDKDLIYALGFGIHNKNLLSFEHDGFTENDWVFWYILFADTSDNSYSDSIHKSFTEGSFSSDGSFTDGGGGGIGGGGAGGF